MPEVDGFDVLQAIGVDRVPVVIFVTAYDQFALRAFEAHALDYLLKPFDDERFEAALQRARERIRHGGEYVVVLHDGTRLTSGRSYRGNLHALLGDEI